VASTASRNSRLDALKSSVDAWAAKEKKRLEAEVKFLKVVQSSSGSSGAGSKVGVMSKDLLVGTIGQFLSG